MSPPPAGRMAVFQRLKLLLWKNFILKKRKTVVTVLEILMPFLFSAIILYLRFNSVPRRRPASNYSAFDVNSLPELFFNYPQKSRLQLAYIPSQSEAVKAVTERVEQDFDVELEVLGFSSVPVFENYIIKDHKAFYILTGIVFHHRFNDSNDPLPLEVQYSLRFSYIQRNFLPLRHLFILQNDPEGWCTSFLYPPNPLQEPRMYKQADGGSPGYNREGFLAIQHAVDKAVMWHHAHNTAADMFGSLSVLLKRFPYGPFIQDRFFLVLQNEFPLLLMLSFICVELVIINSISLEKEKKLKEYMCMMGLDNWLHWVAWFIMFFISVCIAVFVMTILFCIEVNGVAVFTSSDPILIFVFLMCFAIATIFFAFMVSTFFQRAHVGTAVGGIFFFLTYLPYLYLTFNYQQRSHLQKILFCLLSNVAMALGVRFISVLEAEGLGVQWKDVGSVRGEFNFTHVLLMLLLDSSLYCLVAWYVEAVFPGKFGTPKPWYFFAMPSYWRGKPAPVTQTRLAVGVPEKSVTGKVLQEEPTDLMKGIEIQQLYKVFYKGRSEHIAVKGLTVNLYRGQITVLLGHNGAGKTMTCWMLTGLIPCSGGKAYINGYEISQDMAQIRKSMGWCPQHDILFDNLTVAEHLSFYAQLKGLSPHKCPEEVKQMLHVLSLEDKRDSRCRFLSGGMKRKLSIGIALIAGSKVLILDEPTSGMDAISRRAVWDLLQQQKSDRTILLTTHFMDEADLLGDRIAIMAKGELQCCGSPLFLKQKYGAGYYITLLKTPRCNTEALSHLMYHHIPNAVLESSAGEEVIFILPRESVHRFESLFNDLELKQAELGIASFGASVTTMEDVFIRVCTLADSSVNLPGSKRSSLRPHPLVSRVPVDRIKHIHSRIYSIHSGLPIRLNTGFRLLCQQFLAMLLKKAMHSWRGWMLMLSMQVLVPLLVIVLSLFLFSFKERSMASVPLALNLKAYGRTVVPFSVPQNPRLDPQLSERFADMLVAQGQVPLEVPGSLETFLLKKAKEEPENFNKFYLVAASFKDDGNQTIVTALFNNQAYHSPALALSLVDNFLFKLLSGNRASIITSNHPQPQSETEISESVLYQGPKGHYLVVNLLFGIAFLSSSFSILTVRERRIKAKHIQFVSGVYLWAYWLSALLWDLISFLVPTLLMVVVFLYYNEEVFTHRGNILALVLMLILYGWAIIPLIYIISFSFESASHACVKLVVMLTFLSIGPIMLVTVTAEQDLGYEAISENLDHAFLALPGHCLGMAFCNLYYNFELQRFCSVKNLSQTECNEASEKYVVQKNIYAWESLGIGKYLTALAISGPVYIILLFLIETSAFWTLKARLSDFCGKPSLAVPLNVPSAPEDQDVAKEAETIKMHLEKLCKKNPLVVKEVSKVYENKVPVVAVNKVSFTVQAKECFGLLGLNGAGKTSIFKMLAGEKPITSGEAFVRGISISSDLERVRKWIGYCPQFDALLNFMTGRETLVMYSRIRGIPECHISTCVDQILEDLVLYMDADKLVKTYSGGNKRKLSTGIALLGEPAVIFLDEPSTGMDPVARRLLWDTVARARESGKAVVITSHSMEECEALCTRLAIMVQGQFKCLGSPQHLKSKFGSGYSLQAKVRSRGQQEALRDFKAFVDLTFPGSVLEDEHQGMVHYHLPGHNLSWAKVFGLLEAAKNEYQLDDYSVSQVSLEDIFLSVAYPMYRTQGQDQRGQTPPPPRSSAPPPAPALL
nr:ATP-binding cassette sub-family A member 17 isoform X2 [Oryctolagus cuniculus]XP_051692155.1 ATP-binding cassette sub-family A member 17 isoform X2 [Oryctolagus cuniculus]XP_051692156.1 ATP-binding cassette sub-family A member 17 isoform X2 [Oryctolagus cuniculus]XP_051692157.1 ATP-binding cassette sub-family A member 17 isoform X2 [Oryctolagus cuniculus]XP_051692158.1 ATP-binding cassette sub-family A member 17 isoform X2 [Oryctolagus cuniculus]XP_051692159.1 ATP-binding cassette sub-famil